MVTIQFIAYSKLETLSAGERIQKILKEAKESKIVLLEGRLRPEEEAMLIRTTMEQIDKKFKGIELAVINPSIRSTEGLGKIKAALSKLLLGNRMGFTIIGPAALVKEIKKDPEKIELLMKR
jgi:uncharacterized protein